jgi:hypothetical protein
MAAHQFHVTLPLRQRPADPTSVLFDKAYHRGNDTGTFSPSWMIRVLTKIIGEHGSTGCSMRYLLILLLELQKARAYALLRISGASKDEKQLDRLQFLAREISRILGRPGLFPSLNVKARFLSILESFATWSGNRAHSSQEPPTKTGLAVGKISSLTERREVALYHTVPLLRQSSKW